MPAKFRIKNYVKGGIYHLYNSGIDGQDVFREGKDFEKYEEILVKYLGKYVKAESAFKGLRPSYEKHKKEMNLYGSIDLLAYCLMPGHIHLLVQQHSLTAITKLMRRVNTEYVMWNNRKYKRHGPLFENVYRAVLLETPDQVLHMTRFIHLNPVNRQVRRFGPVESVTGNSPESYFYSSYGSYIGHNDKNWVKIYTGELDQHEYRKFVENPKIASKEVLKGLMIDEE